MERQWSPKPHKGVETITIHPFESRSGTTQRESALGKSVVLPKNIAANDREKNDWSLSSCLRVHHLILQMRAFSAAAIIARLSYHGSVQHLMEFAKAQWLENKLQRQRQI